MKTLIKILCLSSFLFSLGDREEILSRHENGNKKVVITYRGSGMNETIVKRVKFSEQDQILSIEQPIKKITIEYDYYDNGNLQKELSYKNGNQDGIQRFYDIFNNVIEIKYRNNKPTFNKKEDFELLLNGKWGFPQIEFIKDKLIARDTLNIEYDKFGQVWHFVVEDSKKIKTLLKEVSGASEMYEAMHGGQQTTLDELETKAFIDVSDALKRKWKVEISGDIFIATSSDEMDGGAGKELRYDRSTGEFSGYKFDGIKEIKTKLLELHKINNYNDITCLIWNFPNEPADTVRLLNNSKTSLPKISTENTVKHKKMNLRYLGHNSRLNEIQDTTLKKRVEELNKELKELKRKKNSK